jgi:hypothetical protein
VTIKDKLEKDNRVAFVTQTNGAGFYIFLQPDYYYQPEIKNGLFKANFIHRNTQQQAFDAMKDVIHLDTENTIL